MLIVNNTFSLNMLQGSSNVDCMQIDKSRAKYLLKGAQWSSAIGHQQIAELVSNDLGIDIPMNRCSVALRDGDQLLVAQYSGPRLPEGTTKLPPYAVIRYWLVDVESDLGD